MTAPRHIQEQMDRMNDPDTRRTIAALHRLDHDPTPRPESKSSLAALERKEREEAADESMIALTLLADLEDDDPVEVKKDHEVKKEKKGLPELSNKIAKNLQLSLFGKMPKAVLIKTFSPYLEDDIRSLAALARTCKGLNAFFKPEFIETNPHLKVLAQHVVYGEKPLLEQKLQTLLKENPRLLRRLLIRCVKVKDYSGFIPDGSFEVKDYPGFDPEQKLVRRSVEGTLYRLALGAKDVSREQFPDEGMAEMIEGFMRQVIPDAETEIMKQREQQFPVGWMAQKAHREKEDKAAPVKIVQALANAPDVKASSNREEALKILAGLAEDKTNQDKTYQAKLTQFRQSLNEFRNYLNTQLRETIKIGEHANDQLLPLAFELYMEKFTQFGDNYDSPKNLLYWRMIIGYIQRFVPTCLAQAISQSLYDLEESSGGLGICLDWQSLIFKHADGRSFFYPLPDLLSGLGYAHATAGASGERRACAREVMRHSGLSKFLSDKNAVTTKIYAATGSKQPAYETVEPMHLNVVSGMPTSGRTP